jgi:homocysteine S-methyltransferase
MQSASTVSDPATALARGLVAAPRSSYPASIAAERAPVSDRNESHAAAAGRARGTDAADPTAAFLDRGLLVIDGGLATELEARGADLDDPLWSARLLIENPDLIRDVHEAYYAAGANVAITASYQASFPGLARRGLSEAQAAALMTASVRLADEARAAFWSDPANRVGRLRPLVAASIGPYGAHLHDGSEYRGDYAVGRSGLIAFHRERMAVLAGAGADLLACETIPSRLEAEVLLELLEEHPSTRAWLSFSCRDGAHISDGSAFADCVALAASSSQIVAVGLNCTPPQYAEALVRAAADVTDKPVLAYPNSGEHYQAEGNRWLPGDGVDDFVGAARRWHAAGARLIGGCCRTGPREIEGIASALRTSG